MGCGASKSPAPVAPADKAVPAKAPEQPAVVVKSLSSDAIRERRVQIAERSERRMSNSQAAIKSLDGKRQKAERIIRIAEQTRRYETEREKVLPFYESSVEEEEKAAGEAADMRRALQATCDRNLPGLRGRGLCNCARVRRKASR